MHKAATFVLATVVTAIAIPALAVYSGLSDHRLGHVLRGSGFVPIASPSDRMGVGSLYSIDVVARQLKPICDAGKDDLEGSVMSSRRADIEQRLQRAGPLVSHVKVDLTAWLASGVTYVRNLYLSHADVTEEVLAADPKWAVSAKLMEKRECAKMAIEHMRAGHYVCQARRALQATPEFKLDGDTQAKLAAKLSADEIMRVVTDAIEAQSDQTPLKRDGRLLAGAALNYGVEINPDCLAPPEAIFERVLPQTTTRRIYNFILFRIIEPVWPRTDVRSAMADEGAGRGG